MAEITKKYLDRRTVDRYVEKGLVKENELNSHLKGLPDDAANAQWIEMDLHDAEIVDDDSEGDDEADDEADDEEGA